MAKAKKSAIVTGGGGGIGAAICARLAKDGYRVGVLDIDIRTAEKVAKKIKGAMALAADVTDEKSVLSALKVFGATPDVLVNNAAALRRGNFTDLSVEDFRLVLDVNLTGPFIMARSAAKGMIKRGSGVIINITSLNSYQTAPGAGSYAVSKRGLGSLTEIMALEWGPLGLRVNSVAPGFINSGMSAPMYKDKAMVERRSAVVPSRRLGTAKDIANAVAFLASDEASYIQGHDILVDGGMTKMALAQLPRSTYRGQS